MHKIDIHAHYGTWSCDPSDCSSVDDLRKLLDKYEIEKCILSSAKAIIYDIEEGNKEVDDILKADKRLYGSVVFNPNYKEKSLKQLERYLDNPRFVSMKNHPDYTAQEINSKSNLEILEKFHSAPLTLHTMGRARIDAGVEIAKRYPAMPVFFFHMGCPDWEHAVKAAKDVPNIMFEAVASNAERGRIKKAVDVLGAERMFFGTDLTLLDPAYVIGMFEESGFLQSQKELIYYSNAKRIFFEKRGI